MPPKFRRYRLRKSSGEAILRVMRSKGNEVKVLVPSNYAKIHGIKRVTKFDSLQDAEAFLNQA